MPSIIRLISRFVWSQAVLFIAIVVLAGCGDNLEEEKKAAHDAGYNKGYQRGFMEGRKDGLKGVGLKKEQDIAYRMGKVVGEQEGYDRGFDDGLKRIKSGLTGDFKSPMASLKRIGVGIAMIKVLGLFIYVMWFYTHGTKGDEFIGKIIAIALGPIFVILLIQGTNSYGGIMKFLLKSGAQTGFFVSILLFIIAIATGISVYNFYKRFILMRHSVWTETFCVLIASAMLSVVLGFLNTILQVTHDLSDFMVANIFLAVLTGILSALLVIFTQRAEQQKITGYE